MTEIAGAHHEKLDGTGYFRGLAADQLPTEARIIAVSDIFDALVANRPYRAGLPRERVFEILWKDAQRAIHPECVSALEQSGAECNQSFLTWKI